MLDRPLVLCSAKVGNIILEFLHLVTYNMPKVGKHTLYVESYDAATQIIKTINSWGKFNDPNPEIAIGKIDRFYRISCKATERNSSTPVSPVKQQSTPSVQGKHNLFSKFLQSILDKTLLNYWIMKLNKLLTFFF